MKNLIHTPTGVHITYEEEEYLAEQDDKAYREELRRERLNLIRGLGFAFTITLFALGLIAGGYRLYMFLFPQR